MRGVSRPARVCTRASAARVTSRTRTYSARVVPTLKILLEFRTLDLYVDLGHVRGAPSLLWQVGCVCTRLRRANPNPRPLSWARLPGVCGDSRTSARLLGAPAPPTDVPVPDKTSVVRQPRSQFPADPGPPGSVPSLAPPVPTSAPSLSSPAPPRAAPVTCCILWHCPWRTVERVCRGYMRGGNDG